MFVNESLLKDRVKVLTKEGMDEVLAGMNFPPQDREALDAFNDAAIELALRIAGEMEIESVEELERRAKMIVCDVLLTQLAFVERVNSAKHYGAEPMEIEK